MYYIKHENREIALEADNVYTNCGRCGKEMAVDLDECITNGCLDLYGTVWYCPDCTHARALEHRGEPWAEDVLASRERGRTK